MAHRDGSGVPDGREDDGALRDGGEDGGAELRLRVPDDFRWEVNLDYMAAAAGECLFWIKDGRLYRAIAPHGAPVVADIGAAPDGGLLVRFPRGAAPRSRSEREAIAAYIRDWFDLERDLTPFYRMAESDPLLARTLKRCRGLRLVGIPDLFEAVAWGIIGQQINLAFAHTLKRRLVERYGRRIACGGDTHLLFPAPQTIAALTADELGELRMTARKCEYLIGAARLIADGELTKERLAGAGDVDAAARLLAGVRGIGPWTAHYVLMRCLRFPSAMPIDDAGLHNAVKLLQGMERKPTRAELRSLAAGWQGWEAYAVFYLWRMLY